MALNKDGFGLPKLITTNSLSVALSAFSVIGDVNEWVNENEVITAKAILAFTPSLVPTAGDTIKLYSSRNLVDFNKSEGFPSLTNKRTLLATFNADELASEQVIVEDIIINNAKSDQGYTFAIENLLTTVGVEINAGWSLTIVPYKL